MPNTLPMIDEDQLLNEIADDEVEELEDTQVSPRISMWWMPVDSPQPERTTADHRQSIPREFLPNDAEFRLPETPRNERADFPASTTIRSATFDTRPPPAPHHYSQVVARARRSDEDERSQNEDVTRVVEPLLMSRSGR